MRCERCGRTSRLLVAGTVCGGVGAYGIYRGCPGRMVVEAEGGPSDGA